MLSRIQSDLLGSFVIVFFIVEHAFCLDSVLPLGNSSQSIGAAKASGSMGRWRYDTVYKDSAPLRVASSAANAGGAPAYRNAGSESSTTLQPPTAKPNVDPSARKDVMWFEDSQAYGLNATYDYRFKLRHAPIPRMGTPWPMPQSYLPSNVSHLVSSDLSLTVTGSSCPVLHINFKRIRRNIFGACEEDDSSGTNIFQMFGASVVRSVSVNVEKRCTKYPYLEMDESYELIIKSSGAVINSKEVWGALRGMETFSQLVYQGETGQYLIKEAVIKDYPRFKHRGLLLDTSRHYLRKEVIIDNLEAMAQNKLNVFHWHIVDDQSFPFESKVFPMLTKLGAYNDETHIYTHTVIEEIIEEARIRGIRVIPEFDTPGHTFSWGYGQGHLLTPCYDYAGKPNGKYGPVNPTLKKNYRFLKALFEEVMSVFKDKYIHLGGDEVPFDCWLSNPFIRMFMKRNKIDDIRKVLNLYERELLKSVLEIGSSRKMGSGYIVWQEVFDNEVKLNPDAIVQVWNGDAYTIDRITNAGMKALFSSCWYLDYISYGQDWDKYYRCDQLSYKTFNESLFIGGEVCMWAEFADNDDVTPRIWPRASAAAERLWSNQQVTDVHAAAPRIEAQRCRMLRSGLKVGVLSGPGYCKEYKQRKTTPCSNQILNSKQEPGSTQTSPLALFLIAVIVVLLFIIIFTAIPAQKHRLISAIVHSIAGGKAQRMLILVILMFLCSWFIWWIVRQAGSYH